MRHWFYDYHVQRLIHLSLHTFFHSSNITVDEPTLDDHRTSTTEYRKTIDTKCERELCCWQTAVGEQLMGEGGGTRRTERMLFPSKSAFQVVLVKVKFQTTVCCVWPRCYYCWCSLYPYENALSNKKETKAEMVAKGDVQKEIPRK